MLIKDWYCKLKSLILVVKKNEQVNYLAVPQFICRQFICRTGIIWIVYNNLRSATDALSYCRQRSINKLGWGHLILLTRSVYHVYSRYHKRCTCITSIVNICVTLQFEILCKRCTRRTNKEQVTVVLQSDNRVGTSSFVNLLMPFFQCERSIHTEFQKHGRCQQTCGL